MAFLVVNKQRRVGRIKCSSWRGSCWLDLQLEGGARVSGGGCGRTRRLGPLLLAAGNHGGGAKRSSSAATGEEMRWGRKNAGAGYVVAVEAMDQRVICGATARSVIMAAGEGGDGDVLSRRMGARA